MNGYLRNIWKITEMSIKSARLGPLLLLLRVTEHSVTAELHSTAQENSKYLASCGKTKCLFSVTNLSKFLLINQQMYFLSTKARLLLKYNEDLFKDLVWEWIFFHYTKREKDTIEQ